MATHPDVVTEKLDIAWAFAKKWPASTLDEKLSNFKKAYTAVSEAVRENDGEIGPKDGDE